MKRLLGALLATIIAAGASAQVTITSLPAVTSMTGSEIVPLVQSGSTKQTTAASIAQTVTKGAQFSATGGMGSATSTYSGGELTGGAFSISGLTGTANFQGVQASGSTTMVDVTGTTGGALYGSGNSVFSYYPSVGNDPGDHQRAQQLIRFNPAQDASISEVGLAIDARINSGFSKLYANSTAYALNDLIDVNNGIYRVTTAGTSASTGSGPTGTGINITDGTMRVAWQCHDQCNAKMPLFVSTTAGSLAGKSWAGVYDLLLNSGWSGQFGASVEVDIQNNSGADCPGCSNIFVSGAPGANKVQAGVALYDPSTTLNSWINGVQIVGTKAFSNAGFYDASFGGLYGVYLGGGYSAAGIMMAHDSAQIRFGNGGSSLNRWRVISGITSSSDGPLTIQHSNDNFGSNFTNSIVANADGSMAVNGPVQLRSYTVATLPTCSTPEVAYVTDATSPTYNGTLTGGGSVKTLALCNGTSWTAH